MKSSNFLNTDPVRRNNRISKLITPKLFDVSLWVIRGSIPFSFCFSLCLLRENYIRKLGAFWVTGELYQQATNNGFQYRVTSSSSNGHLPWNKTIFLTCSIPTSLDLLTSFIYTYIHTYTHARGYVLESYIFALMPVTCSIKCVTVL